MIILKNEINDDVVKLDLADITPADLGTYTKAGYIIVEYQI